MLIRSYGAGGSKAYWRPNAACRRNQMVSWRDALRSRPLAQRTRPRQSVALQIN